MSRISGRVEGFDYLHRISEGYTQIRRYAPAFLTPAPPRNESSVQDPGQLSILGKWKIIIGTGMRLEKQATTAMRLHFSAQNPIKEYHEYTDRTNSTEQRSRGTRCF
jgi:hypothetical protein